MADLVLLDPLGRSVTLHDHTWFGHILKRHPDVSAHRSDVEEAVARPEEIRFSAADADCRVYFGVSSKSGIMMAVVADVAGGYVKTAHFVRAAKGAIEWSRPTP